MSTTEQRNHGIAGDQLKAFLERIENLETEKKELAKDIKEVFDEAKGSGFDTKIMKEMLRLRAMDANERDERLQMMDRYLLALGMI